MNGPDVRTPGGNRASAEEIQPTTAIIGRTDESGNASIDRITDRLELAGFAVHRLEGSGFLVSRWSAMTRHCPDARALSAFAEQVGA
jgi:hypothetical protein